MHQKSIYEAHEVPGGVLVEVCEDVEFEGLESLREGLRRLIAAGPGVVVVDLGGFFVGAAGVGMLAQATEAAAGRGTRMVVTGLPPVWEKVLPAMGLQGRLNQAPDVVSAYLDSDGR